MDRTWILYDARACGAAGTDEAEILVTCSDEEEARGYAGDYGDMACYSYVDKDGVLVDERWEWDWTEDGGFTP